MERTARTRQNILAVTRTLILEGISEPTAAQVADRAEITTRTLFRHFQDMESLHQGLIEDAERSATRIMDEPFPEGTSDDWQQLLDVIINRRVRVYESLLPLYISTIWTRSRATTTPKGIRRRRSRLKSILPRSMATDTTLFEALDGVLSLEYWASLRRDQGLGVRKAADVVSLAVERLTQTG